METLEAWLVLLGAPGLGPVQLQPLLERTGSAPAALEAARAGQLERPPGEAARRWLRAPDPARIEAGLEWLSSPGHHLVAWGEADYPPLLAELPGAPLALFVAGDPATLWQPQIAIVGSRNATAAGLDNAAAFARAFGRAGFTITSGLAEGVDGAAHAAALDAGGLTVAVFGTGPDLVYPRRHAGLAERVRAGGALVSEFPPGMPAQPGHFPRRNRIIAGLALGTLVIEAGLRSGSLVTARHALEAGREVFAIPGSIHNPLARGCHQLIRSGARLVETAAEVVDELGPVAARLGAGLQRRLSAADAGGPGAAVPGAARDPDYDRLLQALGHDAASLDTLAGRTGLAAGALASMLLILELEGIVASEPGGLYVRRPPD